MEPSNNSVVRGMLERKGHDFMPCSENQLTPPMWNQQGRFAIYSTAATPTAASVSCLATDLTASVSLAIPLSHTHIDLTGFAVSRFTVPILWNSRGQINLVRRLRQRYADLGHGR